MTAKQKAHAGRLARRRDWLTHRIANYHPGGDPSHDKAELAATIWAIDIIKAADEIEDGLLDELEEYAREENAARLAVQLQSNP